jgi:hypothetical protein
VADIGTRDECAAVVALRIGPVVRENLVAKRLLRYRHVLVAHPALLERFGTPTSPDASFALPAAIWVRDANAHRPWRLGEREIEPTAVLAVNDYLHLRQREIAETSSPSFLRSLRLRRSAMGALWRYCRITLSPNNM